MKNYTAEILQFTAAFDKANANISKAAKLRVLPKNLTQDCALQFSNAPIKELSPDGPNIWRNQ